MIVMSFFKIKTSVQLSSLAGRELQQYCQAQEVKQNNKELKTEKALK